MMAELYRAVMHRSILCPTYPPPRAGVGIGYPRAKIFSQIPDPRAMDFSQIPHPRAPIFSKINYLLLLFIHETVKISPAARFNILFITILPILCPKHIAKSDKNAYLGTLLAGGGGKFWGWGKIFSQIPDPRANPFSQFPHPARGGGMWGKELNGALC